MIPPYRQTIRLKAEHVDAFRRLRPSVLARFFQEACIAHTEELGMGRKKTLDRGLLWVLANEHYKIHRFPVYDEEIELACYPGMMLHFFFPRYLEIRSKQGELLIQATAIWTLIDEKSRQMVDPQEKGVIVNGKENGTEIAPALRVVSSLSLDKEIELKATYSRSDINGHLSHLAYFDASMDALIHPETPLKEILIAYKKELRLGETTKLSYGEEDGQAYFLSPEVSLLLRF